MILQALNDYYTRRQAATDGALPPQGFEYVPISYLIVLEEDGTFVGFEPHFTFDKKKRVGKRFLLPQAVKRSSGIAPNLLWDKAEYVLGVQAPIGEIDDKIKREKAQKAFDKKAPRLPKQRKAFAESIDNLAQQCDDTAVAAVKRFFNNFDSKELSTKEHFDDICNDNPNLGFRLRGDEQLAGEHPTVRSAVVALQAKNEADNALCLVSGNNAPLQRLHAPIKGVYGAQASGGNIVSFNADAFCSYGKIGKQSAANAAVGEAAAFGYTTALNSLLDRDSKQRFQVGHTSAVCWAQSASADPVPLEFALPGLIADNDDPDQRTEQVNNLFKSVRNGTYLKDDSNDAFYVLGLAPNNARLSVHFWLHGTVASFSEAIVRYFTELDIDGRDKFGYPTIFRLLCATAALGKAENINPTLERALINAALGPTPYPQAVLNETLRRARTERDVNYYRAALIKAWLIRNNKKELNVSLNPDYDATGYQLGRLFATLEKLQEAANPGLNATIRDRYFSAASSAPVTVFNTLMRLSNHHLKKLEGGMPVYFEKQLGEIITRLPAAPFPARLSLESQGEFAIGYYQQRQHFFKSKKDKSEVESDT